MNEDRPQDQPAPSTEPQRDGGPPASSSEGAPLLPLESAAAPPAGGPRGDGMSAPTGGQAPVRRAPGGTSAERGRRYRERRVAWLKERGSQDGFLIFLGVALAVVFASYVAYRVLSSKEPPPPPRPLPLTGLFNTPDAKEISPGRVRLGYNFNIDPKQPDIREACPQILDWESPKGWVSQDGVLGSGEYTRFRPFFAAEDLSVECSAALKAGTQISLRLRCVMGGRETDYYRFDVFAARTAEGKPFAQISEWRKEMPRRSSQPAPVSDFRPRGEEPFFYRLKFELVGGVLRGYYQGKEVCSLPASPDLPVGEITMWGERSRVAFDNVVIVGTPHPEFIAFRKPLYELLQGPDTSGKPPAKRPPERAQQPPPKAPQPRPQQRPRAPARRSP